MQGLSTKDVYMALMMLQERYHTRITQLFSDGGSNRLAKNLGQGKDFYSEKMSKLVACKNNAPYSQYCNNCERYISLLKIMRKKHGIKVRPGSANETYDFTVLQLCIAAAVKMTNQIPYMSGKTQTCYPLVISSILKEKTMKESCNFQHHVG